MSKYQSPCELAKDLIRPYVERGDSLASLTHMGWGLSEHQAQIGGVYFQDIDGKSKRRDIGSHTLVVTRFECKECFVSFSVQELYTEILDERKARQLALW